MVRRSSVGSAVTEVSTEEMRRCLLCLKQSYSLAGSWAPAGGWKGRESKGLCAHDLWEPAHDHMPQGALDHTLSRLCSGK